MRPITIILIAIAVFAAGAAVLVANNVVQRRAADAAAAQAAAARDIEVLVAARDTPQGRSLKETDLRWDKWPTGTADPKKVILRDPNKKPLEHLPGLWLRRSILEGEPITAKAVFNPGDKSGFMAGMIGAGKKAVGITVTAASTASGFVLPGDTVDVIMTVDMKKAEGILPGGGRFASETILRAVRVLAVDQSIIPGEGGKGKQAKKSNNQKPDPAAAAAGAEAEEVAIVGKTVAIEVTPEEAERVLAAQAAGSLSLALSSMAEAEPSSEKTSPYTVDVDMSRALRSATGGGVKVIKGGQVAK